MTTEPDGRLLSLWQDHRKLELGRQGAAQVDLLLSNMTDDASVNNVPVITGGKGASELKKFYSEYFLPGLPADLEVTPVFQAAGSDARVVDEFVLNFTHDVTMDWLLPGVEPTRRQVKVPIVTVAQFKSDKIASLRSYWDQATILVQIGRLDPARLPVSGVEQAEKILHPDTVPSNELIWRALGKRWDIPDFEMPALGQRPTVPDGEALTTLWTEHLTHEFITLDAAATIATMVPHAHVNHVPTLTGGAGHEQLLYFYANHFIGQRAPNLAGIPQATVRTMAHDTLIDENVSHGGVHTVANDYALPGLAPTGKAVSRAGIMLVHFEGDKLVHEHIYWDQATTISQLGLWDPGDLPVSGPEQAAKMTAFDSVPSNQLVERAHARRG